MKELTYKAVTEVARENVHMASVDKSFSAVWGVWILIELAPTWESKFGPAVKQHLVWRLLIDQCLIHLLIDLRVVKAMKDIDWGVINIRGTQKAGGSQRNTLLNWISGSGRTS